MSDIYPDTFLPVAGGLSLSFHPFFYRVVESAVRAMFNTRVNEYDTYIS